MNHLRRPTIRVPRTTLDIALQCAAAAGIVVSAAILLHYWPRLPLSVPTHFGAGGAPDGWGGRPWLFSLPAVSTTMYVILTLLELVPHWYSYPWSITPDNAPRQYLISRRMVTFLKTAVVWILAAGLWRTCATATGQAGGLGAWFIPVALGSIFVPLVYFLVQGARAR